MDVEREVRDFVVQNFFYGDESVPLKETDSFIERGIVDSTGVLEIVNFLESRYGIAMLDGDLIPDHLDSIQKIARFVRGRRPQGSGEAAP
jgi:acyl carrier protein